MMAHTNFTSNCSHLWRSLKWALFNFPYKKRANHLFAVDFFMGYLLASWHTMAKVLKLYSTSSSSKLFCSNVNSIPNGFQMFHEIVDFVFAIKCHGALFTYIKATCVLIEFLKLLDKFALRQKTLSFSWILLWDTSYCRWHFLIFSINFFESINTNRECHSND